MNTALTVAVDGGPYALAPASDGAMWVTLVHSGEVARITETGELTTFPVAPDSKPSIITAGPDGAMWFTCPGADRIGRITAAGDLRLIELPYGSAPFGITVGPDDALWFTTMAGSIGRLTADGDVDVQHHVGGAPSMIITGPDNALWCTLNERGAIARLEPRSGKVTVRELPTRNAGPVGITMTHDDAVWFTEIRADQLGRIPMGDAIQEIALPGKPHAVVADDADGVWVSLWGADQLARVSGDGEITAFDLPPGSEPHGLAVGRNGAPWVALESGYVLRVPW
ncbi:virginiamycin B lyase [soil metagenome]